jgi:hypothetical protein
MIDESSVKDPSVSDKYAFYTIHEERTQELRS